MSSLAKSRRRVVIWMYSKDPARLRRRRRDKRLSQVQLAALVGCTQQYVSLLESGADRDCSEKIAERICRYLDVDLEDLFEERRAVRMDSVTTVSRDGSDPKGRAA
jgi:transcriptional regulator with XRE-family HTH domain